MGQCLHLTVIATLQNVLFELFFVAHKSNPYFPTEHKAEQHHSPCPSILSPMQITLVASNDTQALFRTLYTYGVPSSGQVFYLTSRVLVVIDIKSEKMAFTINGLHGEFGHFWGGKSTTRHTDLELRDKKNNLGKVMTG